MGRITICSVACAALLLVFQNSGRAAGFRIFDQDAGATARGDAYVATADSAAAVFYNPAGITQLDALSASAGAYAANVRVEYQPLRDGGGTENKTRVYPVPSLFAAAPLRNSPVALGIGVYSTYGLGLAYEDDSVFRRAGKEGKVGVISANPIVALKVSDTLSVGAGPTFTFSSLHFATGIAVPGDGFRFRGTGESLGYNLGARWQPSPHHSFGVSYHGAENVRFSGHTSTTVLPFFPASDFRFRLPEEDAHAGITLPSFILAGYSFRPTANWNFECGIDWTDWASFNTLRISQQNSSAASLPFNYNSSFVYRVGATREFGKGLRLSAGYQFAENSAPEATFSPLVPDSDRHVVSAGLTFKVHDFEIALAYQFAYQPWREIPEPHLAAGDYRLISHGINISASRSF